MTNSNKNATNSNTATSNLPSGAVTGVTTSIMLNDHDASSMEIDHSTTRTSNNTAADAEPMNNERPSISFQASSVTAEAGSDQQGASFQRMLLALAESSSQEEQSQSSPTSTATGVYRQHVLGMALLGRDPSSLQQAGGLPKEQQQHQGRYNAVPFPSLEAGALSSASPLDNSVSAGGGLPVFPVRRSWTMAPPQPPVRARREDRSAFLLNVLDEVDRILNEQDDSNGDDDRHNTTTSGVGGDAYTPSSSSPGRSRSRMAANFYYGSTSPPRRTSKE